MLLRSTALGVPNSSEGGLEEADLLARLADAVLDYVTDGYQTPYLVDVHQERLAHLASDPSDPGRPQGSGRA